MVAPDPEFEGADEYTEKYKEDLFTHIKRLESSVRTLSRLTTEDASIVDKSKIALLLPKLDALKQKQLKLQKWATQFGFDTEMPAPKQKAAKRPRKL